MAIAQAASSGVSDEHVCLTRVPNLPQGPSGKDVISRRHMSDEFYSRHRRTDLQCGPVRLHTESRVTASKPPRHWKCIVRMLVILLTITLCPADAIRPAMPFDWIVSEPRRSSSAGSGRSRPGRPDEQGRTRRPWGHDDRRPFGPRCGRLSDGSAWMSMIGRSADLPSLLSSTAKPWKHERKAP